MDPSTLNESGLESAYDDCVGKVKLHGWWVGVMYVLIIPDESFPCNWGNDDDPCDEEELGAGCSELRSDPCFSTLPFCFPQVGVPRCPPPAHILLMLFTPSPSELTSSISHVSAVTKTYCSLQSTIRKRIQSSTLFVKTLGSSPPHVISHLLLMISYLKRLCKIPLSRT